MDNAGAILIRGRASQRRPGFDQRPQIGSLEPAKDADLVSLNANDHRDAGRYIGANLVHLTMKQGKCVYREGVVEGGVRIRDWGFGIGAGLERP